MEMCKNVIISVTGKQITENSETDALELITEGKYYKDGDGYCITYNESVATGMEGTVTTLKVSKSTVTMMRAGTVNSQFIFQKGRKYISYYNTPYGVFSVGVLADNVHIDMDDKGGDISIDYHIEIDNNKAEYNDLNMSIREAECLNDKCYPTSETRY